MLAAGFALIGVILGDPHGLGALVPLGGLAGAALASAAGLVSTNVLKAVTIRRKLAIRATVLGF